MFDTPTDRAAVPAGRRHLRTALKLLGAVALTVMATRIGGLGSEEIGRAWHLLTTIDPLVVAAVLALQVAWAVGLGRVLGSAARAVGARISAAGALQTSMAAFTVSRVVPGGGYAGGILTAAELTRRGNPRATAGAALAASWAVTTTALATLLLGTMAVLGATSGLPAAYAAPILGVSAPLGAAAAVTLLALVCSPARRLLVAVARRLPGRAGRAATSALASLPGTEAQAIARRRPLLAGVGWSAASWALDATALWLVFAALGHPLDPVTMVLGYGMINVVNTTPELTPGWIGVFEATVAAVFTGLGVPGEAAVAGVLVYRLVSFWLPVAAGIPPALRVLALRREDRSSRRPLPAPTPTARPTRTAPPAHAHRELVTT